MKTKAISLTVAGVMAFQSVGFANPDRTADIGNQAISAAQQSSEDLKTQILIFDDALATAEADIINKDSVGTANGLTIGAAALGLFLGGVAVYTSKASMRNATNATILAITGGVIATTLSNVTGMLTIRKPTVVDITKAQAELDKTQVELENALANSPNPAQTELIARLSTEVQETRKALGIYKEDGSDVSRNRTIARIAQFAGTAAAVSSLVISAKAKVTGSAQTTLQTVMIAGALVSAGGQIASIITGAQSPDTDNVLKEIRETRKAIKDALAGI
ncbi:hypothetical protein [Bdellovibrio sp. HCB337]|uniref:hypothetical protein n=1 Tax=Bdellovibrio sp. HCB337 TaxID=3394358 RepID=UPI0039A6D7F2